MAGRYDTLLYCVVCVCRRWRLAAWLGATTRCSTVSCVCVGDGDSQRGWALRHAALLCRVCVGDGDSQRGWALRHAAVLCRVCVGDGDSRRGWALRHAALLCRVCV